jgi:hypothetical protein
MAEFESTIRGVFGAPAGRSRAVSVVARNCVRGHAEIRQKGPILFGNPMWVTENQRRKALGGGTPAVRNVS